MANFLSHSLKSGGTSASLHLTEPQHLLLLCVRAGISQQGCLARLAHLFDRLYTMLVPCIEVKKDVDCYQEAHPTAYDHQYHDCRIGSCLLLDLWEAASLSKPEIRRKFWLSAQIASYNRLTLLSSSSVEDICGGPQAAANGQ